jgi:hypothetical protein
MFKFVALAAIASLGFSGCSATLGQSAVTAGVAIAAPLVSSATTQACAKYTKSAPADAFCVSAAGVVIKIGEAALEGELGG